MPTKGDLNEPKEKLFAAGLLLATSLAAQAQLVDKKALTLAEARKAMAAATAEAKKNGWNVVIVVADDAGYPLTIDRLDNAQRPSVDISIGKAKTAALFRRPSAALEEADANITTGDFIQRSFDMAVDYDENWGLYFSLFCHRPDALGEQTQLDMTCACIVECQTI